MFLCFCVFVFLAPCIDLLTDKVQPLSRSTETASLRKDLKSMTMENQVISSAANSQNVEHRGLVGRVEELTTRLQHSLNDVDTAKRDREDLMTTYRMVIQERASLEHTVREVFIIHVGGTCCVTWSIDRIIQIHGCITWGVEFIRAIFFIFFFYV